MNLSLAVIGRRLRDARNKAGLTQRQVAAAMDVSEATISYWENGQREIDLLALSRLCESYGYSMESILGEDPDTNSIISVALRAKDLSESDLKTVSWAKQVVMNLDRLHAMLGGQGFE